MTQKTSSKKTNDYDKVITETVKPINEEKVKEIFSRPRVKGRKMDWAFKHQRNLNKNK
jgi:hypothetical protein